MKKLLVVTVVLALLVSCGDGGGGGGGGDPPPPPPQSKKFWAQRADDGEFYQLDAELLWQNDRCEIWVEKGSGVTAAQAKSVADAYINNIYFKMIGAFSEPVKDKTGKQVFNTTLDFAHYYATEETSGGKLTILLLDIQDGYKGPNDAFVAGYFWPYDIFTNVPTGYKTNKRDMLYIDINPLVIASDVFFGTIAHEMQHLMNFATSILIRVNENTIYPMDTWIDEGLSSAAEWIYFGEHLQHRINNFKDDKSGLIAKGNNFFVWGNREKEDPNAVLDDYATVYLFFQWLRLQTGGTTAIYKEIITSEDYDYKAIVASAVNANTNNDWKDVLGGWLIANYKGSPSGVFGYKNDTVLNDIKFHYAPTGSINIDLYPGEGVYSYVTSTYTVPSPDNNILYVNPGTGLASGSIVSGGALLTYNASTTVTYNSKGELTTTPERGIITGDAPPSANITAGRSALSDVPSGPFPISAGDMLRRRGREYDRNFSGMNNLRLLTGAAGE